MTRAGWLAFAAVCVLTLAALDAAAGHCRRCARHQPCPVIWVETAPCDAVAVGASDAGKTDTGKTDTGKTDTGKTDTGKTDTGKTDTGKTGVALGTWKAFSNAAGHFKVQFPGEPKSVKQTIKGIDNYAFALEPTKNQVFFVSYFDLPADMVLTLDTGIKAYAGGRKGTLGKIKDFTIEDEFPGKEAEVSLPDGRISRVRLFYVKQRQYQLVVDGPADFVRGPDADKFFSSFHLIDE